MIESPSEFKRIAIYHPPGIAIWDAILSGVFRFARPDLPWLITTSLDSDFDQIQRWNPDGMIVQCSTADEAAFFSRLEIPVVNVAREVSKVSFPSVQIDDFAVGQLAATYFIERGFENLACYTLLQRDFMQARLEGFRKKATECQITADLLNTKHFSKKRTIGQADLELVEFLADLPRPVGLFCTTDALGLAALMACRLNRIRVPQEISILGVSNNELLCHLEYPSLSSIRLPGEKLGFEAARKLNKMLNGKAEPREALRLPPIEVVNRQSTDIYCIEDDVVRQALEFIQQNFNQPINVASVIQEVDVSRSNLERRFRKLLGRSILEELIAQRIKAAKRILATTKEPLYQVASKSGFSNPRQFATKFRQIVGEKPSQYRDRMSGK